MTRAGDDGRREEPRWEVYIVETGSGRLYTGITTDVERRLAEHRSSPRGARFFRFDGPSRVVYREACGDRSEASRRELQIKGMRRSQKLELIARAPSSRRGEQTEGRDGSQK